MQLTPETAAMLGAMFLDSAEREAETTKKVLAAVPADRLDFKLGDKGRTARELMHHIVESEIWFANFLVSGEMGQEMEAAPDRTKQEIVARYEQDLPAAIAKVRAMTPEQMSRELDFFGVFKYPAVVYVNFWTSHAIHHRGQLSTYLRAMNAHVPSIYGGSADEPFQMDATA
jgi:uncharacterized damage-inducible protein DinB